MMRRDLNEQAASNNYYARFFTWMAVAAIVVVADQAVRHDRRRDRDFFLLLARDLKGWDNQTNEPLP